MKQFRLLTLLALLMTAATGAWATDGIACSASDIGKVLCTDGSIYATVGDATTAQKTAAAMIAYIDATNNKGLAIALADESGTKNYEAAGTACSGKAAVTGGTWRLPSDKDWQYMFIGCGSSESYSPPTFAMSKSYSGLASKLTTAQGAALQSDFYWSSTKDEPNGAWGVVFDGSNATFYMEDKTVDHNVRACLAFDVTSTYTVSLNDGTEDADKWSVKVGEEAAAFPVEGLNGGETVTVTYNGSKKVKSVKAVKKGAAPAPASGTDLATITADYEAKDGETLTGTLASNVKISIADGATVTLKDVTITNLGDNCDWAGISCPGDATLVLEGTNEVCAGRDDSGYNNYPGIYIAPGKTLTIQGEGTLTAYSNGTNPYAAGIGGGCDIISCGNIVINSGTITATGGWGAAGIGGGKGAGCGNITINGGTVTATGGQYGAGIGSGGDGENYGSCGNITISGGTVEATGGENAAGIGGGRYNGACGTITITSGVTSVKATKGTNAPNSIGKGDNGQDITVNIEAGANVTQK